MQAEESEGFNYMDCHTHLLDYSEDQAAQVITHALEHKVKPIVVNTTTTQQFTGLVELMQTYPQIIGGFGVHPCFVDQQQKIQDQLKTQKQQEPNQLGGHMWLNQLEKILKKKQSHTVGEIGLDFRKDILERNPKDLQMHYFKSQLDLAIRMKRAATIHCVRAHGEMLKVLKELNKVIKQDRPHFIMHSYGGSEEITKSMLKLENLNIFFSLSLKRSASLCSAIPVQKLVCETDSPCQNNTGLLEEQGSLGLNTFLHRMAKKAGPETPLDKMETNEPVNVVANVKSLMKYYNMEEGKFASIIYANSLRAFKLLK